MLASLFRKAWSANPIWASMISLAIGIVLVLASFLLGLAFVSYDMGNGVMKQVGFVPALNWSVVLVFLFPAAIFTGLRTTRALNRAFADLPRHKMLARADWTRAQTADADDLVKEIWRSAAPAGFFLFAVALAVGAWDFKTVVLDALLAGALPLQPGQIDFALELDWSVAALFGPLSADRLPGVGANLVFASIAHLVLIVQIAFLLSFYGVLVGLAATLYRLSEPGHRLRLTPDATSTDRRRGFQRLADFFLGSLAVSFFTYLACYFMRVQNLFLRDASFARLDQLMFDNIAAALGQKVYLPHDLESLVYALAKTVLRFLNSVFTTGNLADVQAYLGIGMILIGIMLVVTTLFAVLRTATADSRNALEHDLADRDRQHAIEIYYGIPADTVAARINPEAMDDWPLKWPRLSTFLAYMGFGLACFFFYRLALLWVALQLWQIIRRWPRWSEAKDAKAAKSAAKSAK